jgi:monoamine oxidase
VSLIVYPTRTRTSARVELRFWLYNAGVPITQTTATPARDLESLMTRRTFLETIGQTGGAAAVHHAMRVLQLSDAARPARFEPYGLAPRDTRVIVLGAGLAGLAAAYEMHKLGYDVLVLEARSRPGGRCFSVRQDTIGEESGTSQKCMFDSGLYFNAGAMRIPHTHEVTLGYCRELGVAVEMFCNTNEASYVHRSNVSDPALGRMRLREVRSDWRGYTSELLAKAMSQESLNEAMTAEDRDRIVEWLRSEGQLNGAGRYVGTAQRGFRVAPSVDESGVAEDPLQLAALVRSGFVPYLNGDISYQWPMFQAVGGMDRIAYALAAKVPNVKYGAVVQAIEQPEGRVRVKYRDSDGSSKQVEGDYCVCAMPLSILRDLPVDVAPAVREAIRAVNYSTAGKIGLQFKRRFWEEDDGIYGGITRTDLEIGQIVYPSHGLLSRKGVLIGFYQFGQNATAMGERTPAERVRLALEQGAQIHPQYVREFENAFSVAWQNTPYNLGGWAQWSSEQRKREFLTLQQPDRALYFAGDHLTYQVAWMTGAFESARHVVQALHERASREASVAPDHRGAR